MVLALLLTNPAALEDPEVREFFYDRGGWVDSNAMLSIAVPDDLVNLILGRNWGELVAVEVFGDDEAAQFADVDVDFEHDPEGSGRVIADSLDADGREWSHFGAYGTEESTWLVVPEESPDKALPLE